MVRLREKIKKLIFIMIAIFIFIMILSINTKTMAVTIDGTVLDENNSPIQDIKVKYGSSSSQTDSIGSYRVDATGEKVQYIFPTNKKYKDPEAYSVIYENIATNKKYNIVIVKPENGYEAEYKQIQQILNNCDKKNEKMITYNASGFSDGISDPYAEYKRICGLNYTDNDYINLFIVIGNNDVPVLNTTSEQFGEVNGNIFYNAGASKIPLHMQIGSSFEEVKQNIMNFAKVQEKEEGLDVELGTTDVRVRLKDSSKNQMVKLILKNDTEIPEGEYIGNYIEGIVKDNEIVCEEGTNNPKLDGDGNQIQGNPIEGVLVELYEADGTTVVKNKNDETITARTNEEGKYILNEVPGAAIDKETLELIPKEYVVKFTYGDKEQLAINTKYNGQDYESTEAVIKTKTEEIVTYIETEEEIEEEVIEETEIEEQGKVDIYLVIDNSGSMGHPAVSGGFVGGKPPTGKAKLEYVKEGAEKFIDNIYNIYRR